MILAERRRQNLEGLYDIHTNTMQYPQHMQPTHARWELVLDDLTLDDKPHINGSGPEAANGTRPSSSSSETAVFPKLPSVYGRNFLITDTQYQTAPYSNMPNPGDPATMFFDAPAPSPWRPGPLSQIPQDVVDLLPEENRAAFEQAVADESDWQKSWLSESRDGLRSTGQFRSYQWN